MRECSPAAASDAKFVLAETDPLWRPINHVMQPTDGRRSDTMSYFEAAAVHTRQIYQDRPHCGFARPLPVARPPPQEFGGGGERDVAPDYGDWTRVSDF